MLGVGVSCSAAAAIALGAVLGAWGRWLLTLYFQSVPGNWGISVANLLGGLFAGGILAIIMHFPNGLSPTFRWFFVTGLLGSLTTFSSFTMEVLQYILLQRWGMAGLFAMINILGTFFSTGLGYYVTQGMVRWLKV